MKYHDKKVALLGWGMNGLDAYEYLLQKGAQITIFDINDKVDLQGVNRKKVDVCLGANYLVNGLKDFDFIFRAPGVYRFIPEIINAEKRGVVITSVVQEFFDECKGKIIGVTGTKGKGTTSTLIYQTLKSSGIDAYLAGNIGSPILNLIPKLSKESIVVLELSSFQLIDMNKSPHIAVVLNITSDHMDWHKNIKEYLDAKKNIVKFQKRKDFSVINYDYATTKNFSKISKAEIRYFSKNKNVIGSYVENRRILLVMGEETIDIGSVNKLQLRGEHNWENVTAAICASYLAGAETESIKKAAFEFKGLEHRLEYVEEKQNIKFYDDSFSTGPQPTIAAINSFDEPMTLILGGSDKGLDYNELGKVASEKGNLVSVVLIGQIRDQIKKALIKNNFKGKILDLGKSKMKKIISSTLEITPWGGVVVLSPATASFDMFKSYKDRGNQFKEAVRELK